MRFVMRLGLRLAGRDARCAFFGQHYLAQLRQRRGPLDRRQREPIVDDARVTEAHFSAPFPVGLRDRTQQVGVEEVVAATPEDLILDRSFGQFHALADRLLDPLPGPKI